MYTDFPTPSDLLPRETTEGRDNMTLFERLGFKIGVPQDDLFVRATYPKGWFATEDEDGRAVIMDNRHRIRAQVWDEEISGTPYIEPVTRFTLYPAREIPGEDPGPHNAIGVHFNDNAWTLLDDARHDHTFLVARFIDVPQTLMEKFETVMNVALPRHNDPLAYWDEITAPRVQAFRDALAEILPEMRDALPMPAGKRTPVLPLRYLL